ncbi:MAG: rane protein [Myxococcaceae bacterium]|nr:rane protein [Myxococcaceae bacterium]
MTSTRRVPTMLSLLLSSGLWAFGCGDDDKDGGGARTGIDASVSSDAGRGIDGSAASPTLNDSGLLDSGQLSLSDSQIAGILAAVNQGEIEQGNYAATKAQSKAVSDYAKLMVSMHTQAQSEQTALLQTLNLTPAGSAPEVMLTGNASAALAKLMNTPAGPLFDSGYIADQASTHRIVLELIDGTLLPQASSPALKTELGTTRVMVQAHLEAAKALLPSLLPADAGVVDGGKSDAG